MTLQPLQIGLLAGATVSLIGLAISAVMVSRGQVERERRAERMASVVASHTRTSRIELTAFLAPPQAQRRSVLYEVARLFGFDPQKSALYPARWWFVLAVTFALSWGIKWVSQGMLGSLSIGTVPVGWVLLSRSYFGWVENRRRRLLLAQFPDALAMIVRSIRVGIPVLEAIRGVSREIPAPTGNEFGRLISQVAIGASLEDAVAELADRGGLPEYQFFATALALQNQTGGALSETLDNLADVIRKRAALRAKGRAMTSEARSSAMILAALPVFTGLMLFALNPPYIMLLFNNPTGKTMFTSAVVSLSMGLLLIRTIIKRTLP
jgi:tight adherence protein B